MNQEAIVKPCYEKTFTQGNIYCRYNENIAKDFTAEYLDSDYWQEKSAITATAQGRGTTYFIEHEKQQWVLKHYFRGGLMGKLVRDKYLFTGIHKTRAYEEFNLLSIMRTANLPVPEPIAIRIKKQGFTYQADILTSRIENAQDVVGILSQHAINEAQWQAIGRTIKRFHEQGIYHHDLNCHNILIDEQQKIWLIDFDRGQQKQPKGRWQQENLARLLRSFNKENNRIENFHWQSENWIALMDGYQQASQ